MIKTSVLPVLVAAFVFAACGSGDGADFCSAFPGDPLCTKTYPDGDVCSQALEIYAAGFDEACVNFPDCCFCQCWSTGRLVPENDAPCICGQMERQPCDEEYQGFAEQCLAEPSTCQQAASDNVENMCWDWILE